MAKSRTAFWVVAALVFLVNAVLSLSELRWTLATLQVTTAVLAALAALEAWEDEGAAV